MSRALNRVRCFDSRRLHKCNKTRYTSQIYIYTSQQVIQLPEIAKSHIRSGSRVGEIYLNVDGHRTTHALCQVTHLRSTQDGKQGYLPLTELINVKDVQPIIMVAPEQLSSQMIFCHLDLDHLCFHRPDITRFLISSQFCISQLRPKHILILFICFSSDAGAGWIRC